MTDEYGQPLARTAANLQRLRDRSLDELIGFCKGAIADGVVSQQEAESLLTWIERCPVIVDAFPANVLLARLTDALDDGVLDSEEARDVFELITECIGASGDVTMEDCTSTHPFDVPEPDIVFPSRNFVITGRFAWGPRRDIENAIQFLGGQIKAGVSMQVDYVVCGHFASRDWIHSSFGRKIEQAMDLRADGHPLAIVSERHWAKYLHKEF